MVDVAGTEQVHIILGVSPTSALSLEHELRLIKPALLYADKVTLCSPATSMIAMTAALGELPEDQRLAFLRQVLPTVDPAQSGQVLAVLDLYEQLSRKRRRSREEILLVEKVRSQLNRVWEQLRQVVDQMVTSSGADELVPAIESGLLEVDLLLSGSEDFDPEEVLREFLARLADALTGGIAYPLFDDAAGSLVRAHVAEGLIVPTHTADARARQVAAAADFMSRLPAFPAADVSEILDIRKELRDPLVRFRAGMIGLARALRASALEEEFRGEVEQLYVELVAPSLLEIAQAVEENKYLRGLLGKAVADMKTIATAVLTLGVTQTANLTPLIAGGAAAVTAVVTAAWNKAAEDKRIRGQQFYLLYETQELLERP